MDGRADIHRRIAAVDRAHKLGKNVAARHKARPQRQPVRYDGVEKQCHRHAGEQRQAKPPEIPARGLVQQVKQGERNPREPQQIRHNGIFAEGDQIIQPAVDPQVGGLDRALQQREKGQIKQSIERHEPDRMA